MKPIRRHTAVVILMGLWVLAFAKVVRAATLSEFIGGYDSQLLQWAAATAFLGGMIRTILSLESDDRVVRDIVKTAAWDAGKALFAGLLAFIAVQALRSLGVAIPSEVRFTAVLIAGWQRMATVTWIFTWAKTLAEGAISKVAPLPPKDTP